MSAAIKTKTSASIRIDTDLLNTLKSNAKKDNRSFSNYMEGICQGLREVKMIKDGKLKSKSADELFDEL